MPFAVPGRALRATAVVLALTVLFQVVAQGDARAQSASSAGVEVRMEELINAERARAGVPAMRVDVRLVSVARGWSAQMARDNRVAHDPALSRSVPPSATAWAENVGRAAGGDNGDRLHSGFMGSAAHRANIVDRRFTEVGIGVVHSGGYTYVTQRFTAGAPAYVAPAVTGAAGAAEAAFGGAAAHAVLVRDDAYPDALAAGPLAGSAGPLLLTPPGPALHPRVRLALERMLPAGRTVWIVGGTAAVSTAAEQELRAGGWAVRRLAGPGRIETAEAVARTVAGGGRPVTVLLATAEDWPDAAAGGAYGARTGAPVLLTGSSDLPPSTAQTLRDLRPQRVVALGGPAAIDDAVVARAGAIRVAGPTRQGTAAAIARDLWGRTTAASAPRWTIVPADAPDAWTWALSAAPVAARIDAPVLMAGPGVAGDLRDYLQSLGYGNGASAALHQHGPLTAATMQELQALTR